MNMADSNKSDRRSLIKALGAGATVGMLGLAGCSEGGNGNGGGDGNGSGGNGGDGGGDGGQQSVSWTIGTSGQETATHASGVAFSQVVSENSDRIQMSAQTTGGTTANNRLIDQGQVDIAQSTHNLLWRANGDKEPYADPPIEKTICQTFSYMTLDVFLVKRMDADLGGASTVKDLPEGTTISFGPRGTSAFDMLVDGMTILGIDNPTERFDIQTMGFSEQPGAMNDGRIDACVVYTANQQTLIGWIQQLDAQVDIDVLEWGISSEEAKSADVPVSVSEAPADVWNQEISHDPFTVLPLGYTTAIPAEIEADLVYEYVEILMDNKDKVREASAVLSRHGPDFATDWLQPDGVPVHPGAEQYYKDNDMWNDNLTTLEQFEG